MWARAVPAMMILKYPREPAISQSATISKNQELVGIGNVRAPNRPSESYETCMISVL
jgi:hypothetical protein